MTDLKTFARQKFDWFCCLFAGFYVAASVALAVFPLVGLCRVPPDMMGLSCDALSVALAINLGSVSSLLYMIMFVFFGFAGKAFSPFMFAAGLALVNFVALRGVFIVLHPYPTASTALRRALIAVFTVIIGLIVWKLLGR